MPPACTSTRLIPSARILRHMFPDATVTDHDAARISAHLTQRPCVV
jgi:hypothetical protein